MTKSLGLYMSLPAAHTHKGRTSSLLYPGRRLEIYSLGVALNFELRTTDITEGATE